MTAFSFESTAIVSTAAIAFVVASEVYFYANIKVEIAEGL